MLAYTLLAIQVSCGHNDHMRHRVVGARERRRGQLVLGGPSGEFVYLRGDRIPAEEHLAFVIADG